MQELVPGTSIYVYPIHLDCAAKKQSATAAARYLLSCFFTATEMIEAGNLTGKNNKRGLDRDIIEANVGEKLLSSIRKQEPKQSPIDFVR